MTCISEANLSEQMEEFQVIVGWKWNENWTLNFDVTFYVESCDFSTKIFIFSWMTNENKNKTYPHNFICPGYQFNYHVNWKIEKRVGKKTQHTALLSLNWQKGPEFERKSIATCVGLSFL